MGGKMEKELDKFREWSIEGERKDGKRAEKAREWNTESESEREKK